MVKRHVRQGERNVSRQLEIIADMTLRNQPTNVAKSLLLNFEISLRAHKAHFDIFYETDVAKVSLFLTTAAVILFPSEKLLHISQS